jgi:hypothetical protein
MPRRARKLWSAEKNGSGDWQASRFDNNFLALTILTFRDNLVALLLAILTAVVSILR